MSCKKVLFAVVCATFCAYVNAAQISDADLVGLAKQEIDNDSERLFEYVKTTSQGIRLGCKGKVRKGDTGKVQALFIEDQTGRREVRRLGPVKAKVKKQGSNEDEERYVPLRDFPMYCLERVFTSSTCPPGPSGKQGRDGRNGTVGLPGTPGEPGRNGGPGQDGQPGPKGPNGPTGIPGDRGDRGDTGSKGCPGSKGPDGPKGTDGIDGEPGTPGSTGQNGSPGTPGTPGVNGKDGLDGPQGPPGLAGLPGLPGSDGLPGIPGVPGNDGNNGNPGLDGQNGVDGPPGIPGKCCNDPSGGWSSDSTPCPSDLDAEEDAEKESVVSIVDLPEEEAVKNQGKPTDYWANDMFSLLNPQSYFQFKNKQKNKPKAQIHGHGPSKTAENAGKVTPHQ